MEHSLTDPERKRLLYRAMHRGTKENDIAVGSFAQKHLATMTDAQLAEFALILEVPDQDLFAWITGKVPVPSEFAGEVMEMMKSHPIANALTQRLDSGVN